MMVYCKFRRLPDKRNPERFEYKDIMLQTCDSRISFEPDSIIMNSIKEMEQDLKENSEKHRSNSFNLETMLRVTQHKYRRNKKTIQTCSKCGLIIPDNLHEASTSNPYCSVLGPLLCASCSLVLKTKVENEQLQQAIAGMATSVHTQYREKERAILALLYSQAGSRGNRISKGDSFVRKKPLPFTLKQIPRGQSSCVLCKNLTIRRLETYRKNYSTASLKQSLKSASRLTAIIGNDREKPSKPRTETTKMKKTANEMQPGDFRIVAQKMRGPSNSRCSVKDDDVESIINGVRYLRFRMPRTDLEWYEDISERKKEKKRDAELKRKQLDVIQLSSKLSTLFREQNLPPSRVSRASSISSVDLNFSERTTAYSSTGTSRKNSSVGVQIRPSETEQSTKHENRLSARSSSIRPCTVRSIDNSGSPQTGDPRNRYLKNQCLDQPSLSPPCVDMKMRRAISSPVQY